MSSSTPAPASPLPRTRSRSTSCWRSASNARGLARIWYDDPRGLRNYDEQGLAGLDELIGAGKAFAEQHPDFFKEEVEKAQAADVAAMIDEKLKDK